MEILKPTITLASEQSARSEITERDVFKKSQRHYVLDAFARNFPACVRIYESLIYQLAGKGIRSARKIRQRLLQSVSITAAALINLTSAATIKGGFAQSPLLVSGSDVNMAILIWQLVRIGVVIFLISALEAQESPNSATTTEATSSSVSTAAGSTIGESSVSASTTPESVLNDGSPGSSNNPTKPDAADHYETADNKSPENGGYPFVKPGRHRPGLRHVKAHDGFHSLKAEKNLAHKT